MQTTAALKPHGLPGKMPTQMGRMIQCLQGAFTAPARVERSHPEEGKLVHNGSSIGVAPTLPRSEGS